MMDKEKINISLEGKDLKNVLSCMAVLGQTLEPNEQNDPFFLSLVKFCNEVYVNAPATETDLRSASAKIGGRTFLKIIKKPSADEFPFLESLVKA